MQTQLTLADAQIIQRVLNLTRHPLFEAPHRDELPAWYEAITDLSTLVQTVEIEGVASAYTGSTISEVQEAVSKVVGEARGTEPPPRG